MMTSITLERTLWEAMRTHVQLHLPEESCGILGGAGDRVLRVIPVTNAAHSPVRFYMQPAELIAAFSLLENEKQKFMGTFHSHPNGPNYPSQTDIVEFQYPGTATLIWSPAQGGEWQVNSFLIENERCRLIPTKLLA